MRRVLADVYVHNAYVYYHLQILTEKRFDRGPNRTKERTWRAEVIRYGQLGANFIAVLESAERLSIHST